jgi:NDP-sugar pyrophosphorylase family protein
VVSYSKGHGGDHYFVDAGVLILTADVVDWIPRGKPAGVEDFVFPRLAREGRLLAFSCEERFYDIGTPERLAAFERSRT